MGRRITDIIVVKVGTNVLTHTVDGNATLDERSFRQIGRELRLLAQNGTGVV